MLRKKLLSEHVIYLIDNRAVSELDNFIADTTWTSRKGLAKDKEITSNQWVYYDRVYDNVGHKKSKVTEPSRVLFEILCPFSVTAYGSLLFCI